MNPILRTIAILFSLEVALIGLSTNCQSPAAVPLIVHDTVQVIDSAPHLFYLPDSSLAVLDRDTVYPVERYSEICGFYYYNCQEAEHKRCSWILPVSSPCHTPGSKNYGRYDE